MFVCTCLLIFPIFETLFKPTNSTGIGLRLGLKSWSSKCQQFNTHAHSAHLMDIMAVVNKDMAESDLESWKQMQVLLNKFQLSQSLYISRRHPLQRLPLQKFYMNSHVWFSVKSCDRMWSHVFTNENSHDFTCEDSHVPNSHVNFHIISHVKIKWFRMWKLTGFKITCAFYTCEFMWNSCKGI